MTFTLALASQKGGSGKSTLAVNLATAFAGRVALVDLDRQGTAADWLRARPADARSIAVDPTSADVVVLDLPGADRPDVTAALRSADFALIPIRPSVADLRGALPTVHALVRLRRPFAFVLNQVPPRAGSRLAEVRAGLAALGIVAEPPITTRLNFQDALGAGLGVIEYAPASPAAEEIRALARWIEENRS